MSPSELEALLLENPDRPHRLTLASSDQVVIAVPAPRSSTTWVCGATTCLHPTG